MLKKSNKSISLFLIFVIYVFFTAVAPAYPQQQDKKTLTAMQQLEDAVSNVAENAGNTVVGISTQRNRHVISYFRNHGHEFLNDFFRTFFFGDSSSPEYKQFGLGSGVIISHDGYIITNEHVISGADKIIVILADGREFQAKLKGAEYRTDIALLKIDVSDLPYAELGDSKTLRSGQWAIAIGNPYSYEVSSYKPVATFGIISALGRTLPKSNNLTRGYLDLIQTDAAINPGNSGGPLLNILGEVIGINVAISNSNSSGIGFAIPINDAKSVIEKLLQGEKILGGSLGIGIRDINYIMAELFDLKRAQGALVLKVLKGSLADSAGLRSQDIILKFNSEKVENTIDFMKKISRAKQGDEIRLKILRNSLPRLIRIKLSEIPKEIASEQSHELLRVKKKKAAPSRTLRNDQNNKETSKTPLKTWRGMKVAEITKEFANNFEIDTDIGVIVTKVIEGTPAEQAGIKVKDIITQINTFNIQTLEDYLFATSKALGKVLIKTNRAYLMIHD